MIYARLESRPNSSPKRLAASVNRYLTRFAESEFEPGRMTLGSAMSLAQCILEEGNHDLQGQIAAMLLQVHASAEIPRDFLKLAEWCAGNEEALLSGAVLEPMIFRQDCPGIWAPLKVVGCERRPEEDPRYTVTIQGVEGPFSTVRSVQSLSRSAVYVFLRQCGGSTFKDEKVYAENLGGMYLTAWLRPSDKGLRMQYVYASDAQKACNRELRKHRESRCTQYNYDCRCFPCPIGTAGTPRCPFSRHERTYEEGECKVKIDGKRHIGFLVADGYCLSCLVTGRAAPLYKLEMEAKRKKHYGRVTHPGLIRPPRPGGTP